MSNERNDRGRFVERVSLVDVLGVVSDRDEPVTAKEVGEGLDITNRAALNKLNELHDRGDIERKKVGGRSVVWWLTDAAVELHGVNPDDPFWSLLGAFPSGDGPTDVARNHDTYLYGEEHPE